MKKLISILLVALLLFSATSCTSNYEIDENVVKDVSDKITDAVIKTTGKEKVKKVESHTISTSDLNKLIIKSAVGNINITSHESSDTLIDVKLESKANNVEDSKKLIEDFTYTIEEKFKSINIDTSKNINNSELSNIIQVTLDIKIPETIESIVINTNIGDITINNVRGQVEIVSNVGEVNINNSSASYDLKVDVGDINLDNCISLNSSTFLVNTGDINLNFSDIYKSKVIKANVIVGDINMTLPKDSSYETVINEFMMKEIVKINDDGKTKVELITDVGSIDFN